MTHEEGEMFYTGQRMVIQAPGSLIAAHECNDDGGNIYFKDGTVVGYYRVGRALRSLAGTWDWGFPES